MLRSEGLGVPLGGSRGLGSASVGLLRAWECFWGALGGLWLQNSLSAQNRIIRSNSKNTDIYVINTIRRIIRLRRMTHPWCICIVYDRIFGDFPAKNTVYTPYVYGSGQPYNFWRKEISGVGVVAVLQFQATPGKRYWCIDG